LILDSLISIKTSIYILSRTLAFILRSGSLMNRFRKSI